MSLSNTDISIELNEKCSVCKIERLAPHWKIQNNGTNAINNQVTRQFIFLALRIDRNGDKIIDNHDIYIDLPLNTGPEFVLEF